MLGEETGWNSVCEVQSPHGCPARTAYFDRPEVRKLLRESPSATSHLKPPPDTRQDRTSGREPTPDPPAEDAGRWPRSRGEHVAEKACRIQRGDGSWSEPNRQTENAPSGSSDSRIHFCRPVHIFPRLCVWREVAGNNRTGPPHLFY